MKLRTIITGATGMVGEGVLFECLQHPEVEKVLIINRKPSGYTHPKLEEILHENFYDFSSIESKLSGYNTCFFCLGVSSIGMDEQKFKRLTYDLTMHVAQTLAKYNSDMTFCYISGSGTDSTEKGRTMWARVKGKTENDLIKLPFKKVYAFRPGYLHPTKGLKNTLKYYAYVGWMYPFFRTVFPSFVTTLKELGLAMITAALKQPEQKVIEVKDIVRLAKGK